MTFLRWMRAGILGVGLLVLAGGAQAHASNVPTVTAPTSGQQEVSPTVQNPLNLQWSAVGGATWYRVFLSQGSTGANVLPCAYNHGAVNPGGCWLAAGGGTNLLVTALANGAYTLWVQSYGAGGSVWSPATPFTVVSRFVLGPQGKTVIDNQTGLEWEIKTNNGDGSIHDVNTTYTWSTGSNLPDGTAFTRFLAGINAGPCVDVEGAVGVTDSPLVDCSFAGHGDWRLPKVSELMTIVDLTKSPTIDPIFGSSQSSLYWSSSSDTSTPQAAWFVSFNGGADGAISKTDSHYVRAVRSGP